ncbi:hypothetical protein FRC00_011275 [Tulasnella sp. 408]|nr:hypothetical protein FRC00_011275 [Tulasnella sp. 408]
MANITVRKEAPSSLSEAESFLSACRAIRTTAAKIRFSIMDQQNGRQRVNQLPNEILHEILQYAIADNGHGYVRRPTAYFAKQQALRRVSSHWNQIITSSPYFWNTLSCIDMQRNRFEIALEKSRNVGLHVICRSSGHCRRFAERMSEVSQRWVSLDILYEYYWDNHLPRPAPMLKSLIINGQTMQLPELPTQHAQGLSVVLHHATGFGWNTAPVTGLRALELTAVYPAPGLGQLFDIIAANPCLERLSIGDTYLNSDPKSKLRKITMSNLRYIGCPTPATSVGLIDLITHLVVPPNCSLNIRMYAGDVVQNFSELASKLFGYICERINILDPTFSVEMQLYQGWLGGLVLACPPTNPVIFVRFSWWVDKFAIEEGLRHIIDALEPAFRGTRELRFSGKEYASAVWKLPQLSKLFIQSLPHLSRLAVPSTSWALEYLAYPESTHGPWVCPNLQHLRLLGGVWQPKLLVKLLEKRRDEQAVKSIETILLENIDAEARDLETLKELVSEVVVEMPR